MKNTSLLIKIKTFQGPFAAKQFANDGASVRRRRRVGRFEKVGGKKRVIDLIEISSSCKAKKRFGVAAVLLGD